MVSPPQERRRVAQADRCLLNLNRFSLRGELSERRSKTRGNYLLIRRVTEKAAVLLFVEIDGAAEACRRQVPLNKRYDSGEVESEARRTLRLSRYCCDDLGDDRYPRVLD